MWADGQTDMVSPIYVYFIHTVQQMHNNNSTAFDKTPIRQLVHIFSQQTIQFLPF